MGNSLVVMSDTNCGYFFFADIGSVYPAFGPAVTWSWEWMWPILLRNVIGTWLICGGWDWLLYFSPLSKKFEKVNNLIIY